MLLIGDIGATKVHLAVYTGKNSFRTPLVSRVYSSGNNPNLDSVVLQFISEHSIQSISKAIFAVAGPVMNGNSNLTNISWNINEKKLQKKLNIPSVRLLNDLEAHAYSIPLLQKNDMYLLNKGKEIPLGNKCIIAPGTGLGEAFLVWAENKYKAVASEGAHASFAPTSSLQVELLEYMKRQIGHVDYDRLCSGKGIANIYSFLKITNKEKEPAWLSKKLEQCDDKTPLIIETALNSDKNCRICKATLQIFLSILGSEASNLALKALATGGVYIGGGIPPRILLAFKNSNFLTAFFNKGPMAHVVKKMPIYIILNKNAPIWGAAYASGFFK